METLADALQARSCAYRLLAFFMALPTRDVADSVLAGSLRADVEEIADGANFDPEEARRVTEALDAENSFWQLDAEEALRALRLDYTMLFTNPEGAVVSPYEASSRAATISIRAALRSSRPRRSTPSASTGSWASSQADTRTSRPITWASRRSFSAWSTSSLLGQLMTAATRSASGSQPSWRTSTAAIS